MEPITQIVDYPSFYPPIISSNYTYIQKELERRMDEMINTQYRIRLGGNKGIHKPDNKERHGA